MKTSTRFALAFALLFGNPTSDAETFEASDPRWFALVALLDGEEDEHEHQEKKPRRPKTR